MTLFQIAFKNIKRDKHTYFSYYISSTITILLFFLFMAAAMHPDLYQIEDGSTLSLALAAGNFVIYTFAFLFIGYSSWAFLGSRGKQLGIYTILGMSPKQMKKMLFRENIFIGISALLSGLIGGLLFSGLFFKLIRNVFETGDFAMYLPILPMIITFILFMFMFLIIGWITPYFISHKKVLSFLKSDKNYAKYAKISIVKVFISLLCFIILVFLLMPGVDARLGDSFTPLMFLVVIGCVFLITPQIGAIYSQIRFHTKNHLKGIRLFADSEISSTIKENEHMMSLNAVLLAISFLAICALGSMQSNLVQDVEGVMPFAYTYIEREGNTRVQKDIEQIDTTLSKVKNIQKIQYTILKKDFDFGFIKESDFNEILSVKNKGKIHLAANELVILPGSSNSKKDKTNILDEANEYIKNIDQNIQIIQNNNQMVSISGSINEVYVIQDGMWEQISNLPNTDFSAEKYTVYEDKNWLEHLLVADKLEGLLEQDIVNYDRSYAFSTLGNYYSADILMRKLCTFVGFSISMIFLVASVSIIYFRLYTSLEREKKKYNAMYKLGFSKNEMRKTIRQKVQALLWIPFIVAMIVMWSGILYMDTLISVSNVPMSLKYSFIFIVSYIIFYWIVVKVYQNKFEMN